MNTEELKKMLPPAPAGVTSWIHRDMIDKTYIIYDRNKDEAVCTRCGHRFRTSRFEMKHNDKGSCPRCKSEGTYKSSGKGRKNLTEYFRVLVLTHRGNTVYGTLTEVTADFEKIGKPQLRTWMSAVYVFDKAGGTYYKHKPSWYWNPESWEKVKKVSLPHPPAPMSWYATPRFEKTEIYPGNLESVFMHSCLKYGWQPDLFERYEFTAYEYISYIDLHLRYRSIELLAKAGFEFFVAQKVFGRKGSGCINWNGKSLEKILRLPRRHIKKLRFHEIEFYKLMIFQKLSEQEKMLPWETVQKLIEAYNRSGAEHICKFTSIIRWAAWAAENDVSIHDWLDYIRDCEKLGLDVRKNKVLFPESFQITHARLSAKVEAVEDAEKAEGIRRVASDFGMKLETDSLVLKIAHSQSDLNVESSVLSHCVRTYGDRVAAGNTVIYFIRKVIAPDEPYFTLEIRTDGRFVQCRGKHNCGMTPEVEAFKDLVVAEFNRRLKKKERKTA